MRIVFTSDLHVDSSAYNRDAIGDMVNRLAAAKADVLVIAGDVSDDVEELGETLEQFAGLAAECVFVPGNHDVWLRPHVERTPDLDSTTKYDIHLAARVIAAGFNAVWKTPCVVGEIAFVGTIGWYDYAFAPAYMNLTTADCERRRYEGYTWQDLCFALWRPRGERESDRELSDVEVTRLFNDDLTTMLREADARNDVGRIITVIHHLPFPEMVRYNNLPKWDYFCAFMGSAETGRIIEDYEKVTHVLAGHTHCSIDVERNGRRCVTSPLGYLARKKRSPAEEIERAIRIIDL